MRQIRLGLLMMILCAVLTANIFATEITSMDTKFVMGPDGNVTATSEMLVLISEGESQVSFPIGQGQNPKILGQNPKVETTEKGRFLTVTFEAAGHRSQEFTMTYQVENPITPSGDELLLTLPILPEGSAYPIGDFQFSVELPGSVESAPVYVGGYYSEIADNYFDLTKTATSFSGKSLEALRDHDDLTATLVLPKGYIQWNGDEGMAWWLCALLLAGLAGLGVSFWSRKLRNRGGLIRASRLPAGVGAGDLGWILDKNPPSLPLELAHWASRGLVVFHLEGRDALRVSQRGLVGAGSAPAKRKACDRIFGQVGEFYHNDTHYGREIGKYEDAMTHHWKREIMDKNGGNPGVLGILTGFSWGVILAYSGGQGLGSFSWRTLALWLFFFLGLGLCLVARGAVKAVLAGYKVPLMIKFAAVFIFFLTSLLMGGPMVALCGLVYYGLWQWCSYRGGKRSKKGLELYGRCRGFRRHVKALDAKTLKQKCGEDPNYFYNLIGYAHALGQGEKLVHKMGKIPLQPCPWLISNGKKARNAGQFYAQYKRVLGLLTIDD